LKLELRRISAHDFLEELQRSITISPPGNKVFQNFSFVIDGTPQVMCFTIDLYEDFVQMPTPVGIILGRENTFLPDLIGEQWPKSVPPIADCFMTDIDTSFMKKDFDIAK
jgi:hypothetical protein|tara:strand:+ start:264 stop:593 length:330 start_codon:yes stop_codon:yes gene_type:complete